MMEPLDGNAIAGELFVHFGREMTTALGTCGHCGAVAQVAELVVYACAPGTVVRCPNCKAVVLVLVATEGRTQMHVDHLTLAEDTIAGQ
jgi:phage FluMu protein Com